MQLSFNAIDLWEGSDRIWMMNVPVPLVPSSKLNLHRRPSWARYVVAVF